MRQSRTRLPRAIWALVAGVLVASACSGDDGEGDSASDGGAGTSTVEAASPGPDGEWVVEGPDEHGMDVDLLAEARDYAFHDGANTQGVVVVHGGAIVSEWYAEGTDAGSWTASWSVAKSVASATVGIAIEEGLVPSVDEPMTTWFPDWEGTDKAGITLRNVLNMESGLDWDEEYDPNDLASSEVIHMVTSETDPLTYAASRPLENEPGSTFNYSSGDAMLLSAVVEQASGMPFADYAQARLFEPLGMERAEWWRDAAGHTLTYCCFDSTSRSLARLGQLYLQHGRWGDEQLVPEEWVEASVEPSSVSEAAGVPYGYMWWLGPSDGLPEGVYAAEGHDGQFVYVVPEHDLVVVRNGTYVKSDGPAVADPNLFNHYPSDDLVEGQGTTPPDEWDATDLLSPIVESLGGTLGDGG